MWDLSSDAEVDIAFQSWQRGGYKARWRVHAIYSISSSEAAVDQKTHHQDEALHRCCRASPPPGVGPHHCSARPVLAPRHSPDDWLTTSSVNGADNGEAVGIRTALSNNPIQNVNDGNIACNSNFKQPVSTKVIAVKGGDRVGVLWGHVIGGAQFSGDPDQPIAKSHKGPTIFYMYVCLGYALMGGLQLA